MTVRFRLNNTGWCTCMSAEQMSSDIFNFMSCFCCAMCVLWLTALAGVSQPLLYFWSIRRGGGQPPDPPVRLGLIIWTIKELFGFAPWLTDHITTLAKVPLMTGKGLWHNWRRGVETVVNYDIMTWWRWWFTLIVSLIQVQLLALRPTVL